MKKLAFGKQGFGRWKEGWEAVGWRVGRWDGGLEDGRRVGRWDGECVNMWEYANLNLKENTGVILFYYKQKSTGPAHSACLRRAEIFNTHTVKSSRAFVRLSFESI